MKTLNAKGNTNGIGAGMKRLEKRGELVDGSDGRNDKDKRLQKECKKTVMHW